MRLRFGDPDKIIVECDVEPSIAMKRELWTGLVWLTVNEQVIGNVEDRFKEEIGIALGSLSGAAHGTGKRQHALLRDLPPAEAIDLVMWAVYGDDEAHPELKDADRKVLSACEILSSRGGPAFDDWEGIMVESGSNETIMWRREGEQSHTRTFPIGTFWAVTEQAQIWLRSREP